MSVLAKFTRGESGEVLSWDGATMIVRATAPYAPGSPAELRLTLPDGEITIEARTKDSKRSSESHFDVRLRVINLRREDRERLALALTK